MNNKNENMMLDIFKRLGIHEREGRILIVLNKFNDGLKQKDICTQGYIYQPEVSVGLKNLMYRGWVTIIDRVKSEKKGRPFVVYALVKSFDQIIAEIQIEITCEYESVLMGIEKLKEIA